MIIQCKKCGTKYRFDKSQIEGEGIWVRCTRCEATFFQKNPLAEISSLMDLMETGKDIPVEEREATAEGSDTTLEGPVWEDDYRDAGEEIEIEGVEEEAEAEGLFTKEAEAGDPLQGPTGEDDYEDVRGGGEIGGVEEAVAGDSEKILGEIEFGSDEPAPAGGDIDQAPRWEKSYEDVSELTGGGETGERQRVREPWSFDDTDEVLYNERIAGRKNIGRLWTLGKKIVLYLLLVAVLLGGIYLWLVPESRDAILNRASPWVEKLLGRKDSGGTEGVKKASVPKAEKMMGIEDTEALEQGSPELKVTLVDVAERFVKGWTAENIMVVEGSAVNSNTRPVSSIRVRGKILDSSGDVLFEEESTCGTILTDDELKSLTRDEIKKELSNPYGRDFRNADIQPGDGIPFMLVFTMPAEEASELVVELAGIDAERRE